MGDFFLFVKASYQVKKDGLLVFFSILLLDLLVSIEMFKLNVLKISNHSQQSMNEWMTELYEFLKNFPTLYYRLYKIVLNCDDGECYLFISKNFEKKII